MSPLETPEAKSAIAEIAKGLLLYIPALEIDAFALRYADDPAGLARMIIELQKQVAALDPAPSHDAITACAYVLGKMIKDRARELGRGGHA